MRLPFEYACSTAPGAESNRQSTQRRFSSANMRYSMNCGRVIKEIQHIADPTSGEVRIAVPEILAAGFVPDVTARIAVRHPQISIQVVGTSTLEFRELRERKVDLLLARVPETVVDDGINLVFLMIRTSLLPELRVRGHGVASSRWPIWQANLGLFHAARSFEGSLPALSERMAFHSPRAGDVWYVAHPTTFAGNWTLCHNHCQFIPSIQCTEMVTLSSGSSRS